VNVPQRQREESNGDGYKNDILHKMSPKIQLSTNFILRIFPLKQEADLHHAARLAADSSEGTETKPRRHAGSFYKRKIAAGEELLVLVRGSRGERPSRATRAVNHVYGIGSDASRTRDVFKAPCHRPSFFEGAAL